MSISSMTGFARESFDTGHWRIVWELKTVNGKGLDLRLRLPAPFDALQEDARRILGDALKRGTCFATMTAVREGPAAAVRVNTALLEAVVAALEPYDGRTGMRAASLDAVLGIRGVVEVVEAGDVLDEEVAAAVLDGLRTTVGELRRSRAEEGRSIAGFLESRLETFGRLADAADRCPARKPEAIGARLADQLRLLIQAGPGLDPQRLHQEAVLMAAKADIREEIDRIRAHIEAVRGLLAEGGPIGRRLDFIAQEFSREANTLCAKANDVSLTVIGLDLKTEVEQFREQVQNVE
jgi:uncharacterized protein (TIGR00255 family)